MGFSFAELLKLGNGRHELVECDEHDFRNTGAPPDRTPDQEQIDQFEEVLFGYQQGAFTSLEVLAVAERVLSALGTNRTSNEREEVKQSLQLTDSSSVDLGRFGADHG